MLLLLLLWLTAEELVLNLLMEAEEDADGGRCDFGVACRDDPKSDGTKNSSSSSLSWPSNENEYVMNISIFQ